ncbi:MAG: exodeoxyribonuclease VII large subunit, partial [Candidatus Izemoplasmatales bacterium]|nr:exodeoxyribonuclease VII large subunit [Candidatus Izemoplasmatales bacterium]
MENKKYLTVTALNKYISYKFESDVNLGFVYIQGELSNTRFSKDHLYFVLKDSESEISGIMYASSASKLTFMPKDGTKVLVSGKVSVYQKKGTYNLTAITMSEFGLGALYQDFLLLKEKLDKEGLFDVKYKKKIPEFSEKIGVITSPTGDAFQDIRSTISLRFPIAKIYLYPALVQGIDAPKSLIKALDQAYLDNIVDVIIIARGGGSIEDLSCFNNEELARKIFSSKIPIVSGVGHETDFTICDFVADDRAPTPTGAAVRVTKNKALLIQDIENINKRLSSGIIRIFEN